MNESNKPRLLLVEDDEIIRDDCARLLAALTPERQRRMDLPGFDVDKASDAETALRMVRTAQPPYEVTVLDLGIPRSAGPVKRWDHPGPGLELLQALAAEVAKCGTIVISSVKLDEPEVLQRLLELGSVRDFVPKPWTTDAFLDCVERAFLRRRGKSPDGGGGPPTDRRVDELVPSPPSPARKKRRKIAGASRPRTHCAIGIASGHRKTHALAVCDAEVVAFAGVPKSLNFHNVTPREIRETLGVVLEELARDLDVTRRDLFEGPGNRIVLSLPGVCTKDHCVQAFDFFEAVGCSNKSILRVVDDTWSGMIGGLAAERGICAFAGSGASVFFGHAGFRLGKPHKLDGYGVVIGDFGSGFRAAVHLLEHIGRSQDAGKPCPLLKQVQRLAPALQGAESLQEWFDGLFKGDKAGDWRQEVAKLAEVVTVAAARRRPDTKAKDIVMNAAAEMAGTIMMGLDLFRDGCQGLPIVCQGGMFRYSDLYFETVQRVVNQKFENRVQRALYHPVVGAALTARAAADEPSDPLNPNSITRGLPSHEVTEQILNGIFRRGEDLENLVIMARPDDPFGLTPSPAEQVG